MSRDAVLMAGLLSALCLVLPPRCACQGAKTQSVSVAGQGGVRSEQDSTYKDPKDAGQPQSQQTTQPPPKPWAPRPSAPPPPQGDILTVPGIGAASAVEERSPLGDQGKKRVRKPKPPKAVAAVDGEAPPEISYGGPPKPKSAQGADEDAFRVRDIRRPADMKGGEPSGGLAGGGPIAEPQSRSAPAAPEPRAPADRRPRSVHGLDFIRDSGWEFGSFVPRRAASAGKAPAKAPGRESSTDLRLAALTKAVGRELDEGDDASALRDADQLLAMAPGDARVHHVKGMILIRLEKFEEASREAEEAIRLDGTLVAAHESLAWSQLQLGRYERAAAAASDAIALDPSTSLAYAIRASANERLGRQDLKAADIRKAAALNPARFGAMAQNVAAGGLLFPPPGEDERPRPGVFPPVLAGMLLFASGAAAAVLCTKLLASRRAGRGVGVPPHT